MSLAAVQDSFLSVYSIDGQTVSPSSVSTQSLSVSGVPVTGLDAAGQNLSADSGCVIVKSLLPEDADHPYAGRLQYNNAENVAEFSDTVYLTPGTPAGSSFTYQFPVKFTEPPALFFSNPLGGESVILTDISNTYCAGNMRFLSAQNNKFNITSGVKGAQPYVPPTSVITFPQFSPSQPSAGDNLREPGLRSSFIVGTNGLNTFTTPANLDPTKASIFKLSWATQAGAREGYGVTVNLVPQDYVRLPYKLSIALSSPGEAEVPIATWFCPIVDNLPPNTNGGFANSPYNQYQYATVQLLPDTTYTTVLLITYDVPPNFGQDVGNSGGDLIFDFSELVYYPVVTPPAAAAARSVVAARSAAPVASAQHRSSARSSAQQPVGRVVPPVVRVSPSVQQPASGPGQRVLRYNM